MMKRSPMKRGNGFKSRKERGEPKRPSLSKRSAKKLREAGEKKRKDAEKVKVSTLKRDPKKALGTAKPKEGTWRYYADMLESKLAKRAKMRDDYQCRQCRYDGAPTQGILDAGHIYPKGKFPGGKYLIENIVGQCRRHNEVHIARPEMMLTWYQKEVGEEALERLHQLVLAQPRRQSIEWMIERIAECDAAIKDMELLAVA